MYRLAVDQSDDSDDYTQDAAKENRVPLKPSPTTIDALVDEYAVPLLMNYFL